VKRSPINRVSSKRRRENAQRKAAMIERFGPPETWHCSAPMFMDTHCYGEIHGHEILKRSRGGSITDMDNVVLLCDFHNGVVEDQPEAAHREGLARHSWENDD